jgi:ribosomal RNA assembly protein
MAEFSYQIKIPKDRIAVLIGRKGEIKKQVEEATKTKIDVDSKEGEISVSGEDAIMLYTTRDLIRAIARGFNPEIAFLLLKQDYTLDMINLPEFDKPSQLNRIKGRVIGTAGRTRTLIEEHTESYVSVYGKTICIIGMVENVIIARRAIEMLIKGSPHANVYRWLERMRKELKKREFDNFEDHLRTKDDVKEE